MNSEIIKKGITNAGSRGRLLVDLTFGEKSLESIITVEIYRLGWIRAELVRQPKGVQ